MEKTLSQIRAKLHLALETFSAAYDQENTIGESNKLMDKARAIITNEVIVIIDAYESPPWSTWKKRALKYKAENEGLQALAEDTDPKCPECVMDYFLDKPVCSGCGNTYRGWRGEQAKGIRDMESRLKEIMDGIQKLQDAPKKFEEERQHGKD